MLVLRDLYEYFPEMRCAYNKELRKRGVIELRTPGFLLYGIINIAFRWSLAKETDFSQNAMTSESARRELFCRGSTFIARVPSKE